MIYELDRFWIGVFVGIVVSYAILGFVILFGAIAHRFMGGRYEDRVA